MGPWDITVMIGDSRLSVDAADGRSVPVDLRFSTSAQGGPQTLELGLQRSVFDIAQERPYDPVRVLGPNGNVIWEGRLATISRTVSRTETKQSPQAIGLAAILEDRQDARFLGIDRDLGNWRGATTARRIALTGVPLEPRDGVVRSGAIQLDVSGAWSTNNGRPHSSLYYSAAPLKVGRLIWGSAKGTAMAEAQWTGGINQRPGLDGGGGLVGGDWFTVTGPGDNGPQNVAINAPVVDIEVYTGLGSASEFTRMVDITDVAVVGDHGLPLYGTSAANYGLKASDVVPYLLKQFCDPLTPGIIADSVIPLQHLAYMEPQTPGAIVNAINAYHAWTWGVWQDGRFDFHPFGEGNARTWYVRASDPGVQLRQEGDDGAQLYTDIVVSYQTASGEMRTVGSPFTLADAYDPNLALLDPEHPGIRAGVRRVYHFALDVPSIQETAASIGRVVLGQLNAARRAGTIELTGMVADADGNWWPSYLVRGGDQIVITDRDDLSPRQVASTQYTHATRTVDATIDNQLQTVEAIVGHLGARTTGRL